VHLRAMLAREVQTAIERGELELRYRPQVHIPTGNIVGLETQVLWNHPSRGIIKSDTLLAVAERVGMMRVIGEWACQEACAQLRSWLDHGLAPPVIAIDMSLGQLKATGIVAGLNACLEAHGIGTDRLELEFEEHVFTQTLERYPTTLEKLRNSGYRIAITNFGSGYAPISYLAKLPVQRVKMPGSMVAEALNSAASAKAIRAIVSLARTIGAEVIADGVETPMQAAFLLAADCENAQGRLFGPLLSALDATLLLRGANIEHPGLAGHRRFSVA
jgi:EAL domain-containing protein (putative c-di-GMP-specific phosphodiesterase class I)